MKKYNLNFHRTFPPTAEYITRLLEVCDHGDALTKEQISELTGIPTGTSSGKVEPHIFYGEYMGLLRDVRAEGKHRLLLTPLGKEILNQDPGLFATQELPLVSTARYFGQFYLKRCFQNFRKESTRCF